MDTDRTGEAVPSTAVPAYVGPMTPGQKARARPGAVIKLTILLVALALVTLLVLLLIPRVVRDRLVAGAREAGFELTIDGVGVGFDGVSLRDVTVRAPRAPGIIATIPAVHLSGLTGNVVRLHDPQVKLSGSRSDVEAALGTVVTDARAHLAGAASSARHVSVIAAHVTWDGIFGEGTRLSAGDIGVEVDSRGPGAEDVHGSVGGFEVVVPGTNGTTATLGPWASAFETSPSGSRVRVMFDPPVPDGPSLLYVWGGVVQNELTVRIPRSPLANLGVKPEALGLPATASTEVEAMIEGKLPSNDPQTFHGNVKLWGVRPKGMSAVNVSVVGSAVGAPGKPFQIDKAIVEVGPFAVGVTGSLLAHDHGLRLDAVFKSLPLTCASLAKDQVKTMGSLVETLHAFGETTGLYRITGNVNVSGVVKYDTGAPDAASVTWLAKETCGVSIFGR